MGSGGRCPGPGSSVYAGAKTRWRETYGIEQFAAWQFDRFQRNLERWEARGGPGHWRWKHHFGGDDGRRKTFRRIRLHGTGVGQVGRAKEEMTVIRPRSGRLIIAQRFSAGF